MTVDEKALREAVDRAARTARSHSHHALWAGLPTDSLERFGIALAQRIESAIRSNAYEVAKAPAPKPAPSPAAVQGSGATVKPIDWRDMTYKGVEEWLGHCALSQSFTIKDEGPLHEGSEYRFVVRPILSGRTSFPTADEAKAAAQADYEQRIRSALYPAPTSESEAEQFIQAAVDSAPEPLRRLGEWLAGVLDEDDWKTAERMLIGAALANPGTAAGDVREALESVAPYLDAIVCYASTISEHDGNRVAKLVRAALSASASAPGSGVAAGAQRQVRHLKRGSTYHVLGEAEVQISVTRPQDHGGRLIEEGDRLTVYRCRETGKLWARFPDEFNDGRFQEIA